MSQYVDNHSASSALSEQKVIKLLRDQFQSCFFLSYLKSTDYFLPSIKVNI